MPLHAQKTGLPETDVKSAFLFNFIRFVEWPQASFASPTSPITVCFLRSNELADTFEAAVRGKSISTRPITARRVDAGPFSDCHVLYVGQMRPGLARSVVERLR